MDQDSVPYMNNMEKARKRFESEILATNSANKRSTEEYFQFMDESQKYANLQKIKKKQENMVNRTILEQQIENDRRKKLQSREARKTGG